MALDRAHFRNFVAGEDFDEYLARKRLDGVHANHTEIQAISELYNRSVEVFVPDNGAEPINIFHTEYKNADAPIRLSYHDGNHYNAVINPLVPTAGLGLGLPGLQPGLADQMQLEKAKHESDDAALQQKLRSALEESDRLAEEEEMRKAVEESELSGNDFYKKKALYLSEIEAADFDLEQAVIKSSLDSYRKAEQERKQPSSRRMEGRRKRNNASPPNSSPRVALNAAEGGRSLCSAGNGSSASPVQTPSPSAAAAGTSVEVALEERVAPSSHVAAAAGATVDEYPQTVQELVMNGFELKKVLHAFDLIGDNFDDLLSFLISSAR